MSYTPHGHPLVSPNPDRPFNPHVSLTITRFASTPAGTPGELLLRDKQQILFACKTLELPWHNNQSGISCIRQDSYAAWIWFSRRFKRNVLRLEDKHGRFNCLIHEGNFAGDVAMGFVSHVQGCTLVGNSFSPMDNGSGTPQLAIRNSTTTLEQLIALLDLEKYVVHYQWAPGCAPMNNPS
ncbi:MAG: hypothetical protein HQM04_00180 [Magnetococcales bacterium]|nr:hypothetical protein [Magnetococcales bacterium]MBF0113438.1 hypothetical protein [Magnetococcales bacterium]